jgi:hypothetical protein
MHLTAKSKSTIVDMAQKMKNTLFTEDRQVALRRWKEIGALGKSANRAALVRASSVDTIMRNFDMDEGVIAAFMDARRNSNPPACRHRAGAAAHDHMVPDETGAGTRGAMRQAAHEEQAGDEDADENQAREEDADEEDADQERQRRGGLALT